jgi:hypothetical protein
MNLNPPRPAPHPLRTSSRSPCAPRLPALLLLARSSRSPSAPPSCNSFRFSNHTSVLSPIFLALSWPATCTPEPPTHNCSCSSSCVWVVQKPRQRRGQARTGQDARNPSLHPSQPTRSSTRGFHAATDVEFCMDRNRDGAAKCTQRLSWLTTPTETSTRTRAASRRSAYLLERPWRCAPVRCVISESI